jgi:hypothetical protein
LAVASPRGIAKNCSLGFNGPQPSEVACDFVHTYAFAIHWLNAVPSVVTSKAYAFAVFEKSVAFDRDCHSVSANV